MTKMSKIKIEFLAEYKLHIHMTKKSKIKMEFFSEV